MDQRIVEKAKTLPKNKHISVEIDSGTYSRLQHMALVARCSVSFIVRGIVLTYLEDHPVDLLPSDQEVQE